MLIKEIDYYQIEPLKCWDDTQGYLNHTQRKINEIIGRIEFIENKLNAVIELLNIIAFEHE